MTTFYSVYEFTGGDQGMTPLLKGMGMTPVEHPEDADLIIFNGGRDIGTSIYNEYPAFDGIPHRMSERDRYEVALYKKFRNKKFILGICRGAQLLNCLNGGSLWQHVDRHNGSHPMLDLRTGTVYETTSTHHQMMRPNLKTAQVLAIASESTEKHADDVFYRPKPSADLSKGEDIEIVWYKGTKTLCVQGHPEYVPGSIFAQYVFDLVNELMAA